MFWDWTSPQLILPLPVGLWGNLRFFPAEQEQANGQPASQTDSQTERRHGEGRGGEVRRESRARHGLQGFAVETRRGGTLRRVSMTPLKQKPFPRGRTGRALICAQHHPALAHHPARPSSLPTPSPHPVPSSLSVCVSLSLSLFLLPLPLPPHLDLQIRGGTEVGFEMSPAQRASKRTG